MTPSSTGERATYDDLLLVAALACWGQPPGGGRGPTAHPMRRDGACLPLGSVQEERLADRK
jgi:hypothetical protein